MAEFITIGDTVVNRVHIVSVRKMSNGSLEVLLDNRLKVCGRNDELWECISEEKIC
jgi:hypothetical protein